MWKLTETLKLDREETAKFFAISNQYEEAKKKLHRELHEDLQKLRNILRETHPQEKELREVISRIKTKKRDLQDIRVKQNEEEINFLKTEQQARYILFQIDFRRDMESMIREIREERPRRPGYDGPAEKNR
jgi:Spy/CpxP family protein refolding chaperone